LVIIANRQKENVMNKFNRRKYETKARIVKAMAHPVRLFIIDCLKQKKRCVCDLSEMVGIDVSTVSRHLRVMETAGIVEKRKQGLKVFYSLRVKCAVSIFDCVEAVIRSNLREQLRAVR